MSDTAPQSADQNSNLESDSTQTKALNVRLMPRNIFRIGFVVVGVVAVALLLSFVLDDGGSVIFTVLMAWFASIAMEPAVSRLAKRMKRGFATGLVMLGVLLFLALFSFAFGRLLIEQVADLIATIPGLVDGVIAWVNSTFNMNLQLADILASVNLTQDEITDIAAEVGVNALGIIGSILGAVFSMFTFALFTFYLSADAPRLRRWIASLFNGQAQALVINVWDITQEKTGGYVAARVVLAAINGGSSAIVFAIIGMPYWLALGIWTGLVAQFVPTIGTYISIVLPVIVGLLSDTPAVGVIALVWALIYQQVENLTIEPKISAKAVDVHPAVAFGAVMMGAALFGIAGALLAVPVIAMLLALLGIYAKRYQLAPELHEDPEGLPVLPMADDAETKT
jgi:predicted PurR-regulated permease PerM